MNKLSQLLNWFSDKDSVLVALSGGVDSALVAFAANQQLPNAALAVTADYKTLSQDELDSAKHIANEIGIKHVIIEYNELQNNEFVQNDSKRCFHCRMELGSYLLDIAQKMNLNFIVDGTNLDDIGEYRPGLDALRQHGIRSPLLESGLTKKDVRDIAKSVGLSVHDKPSNSCLASRIPWGQRVTAEKLTRIELSERFIKQLTKIRQIRVRDINGTAKIEVEKNEIPTLTDAKTFAKISNQLHLLGFSKTEIDPDGYLPGKINVIVD